jgi:hypothetical protein
MYLKWRAVCECPLAVVGCCCAQAPSPEGGLLCALACFGLVVLGWVQADGEYPVWESFSLGMLSCVMVSVKGVVSEAFHHQSCCKVRGSAQPDPSCDSGVGRESRKSGKNGVLKVRMGVGNQCVAFCGRG